jgi:3-oxoacyl-[acyl-carrier-protein] synthase III
MKIDSIGIAIPTLKVTNDDILEFIRQYSGDVEPGLVNKYVKLTASLLGKAGAKVRYFRNKEKKETARDLIINAMKEAFRKSSVKNSDIDLLIYCGVGKGFLEPANAYFFADALDMKAQCYDLVDACMSWVRALEVAHSFIHSGSYRNIMIINGEFNCYDHGFPELFKIKDLRQLEYTFPTYTIGEGASATILTSSADAWSFHYKSVPSLCNLCTIPLTGYKDFINGSKQIGHNGPDKFVSYGGALFDNAANYLVKLVKEHIKDPDDPDIYFPHAASDVAYLAAAKSFIKVEKMYAKVFPSFGNLVSASIPVGMHEAEAEGRLKRGHKVVFCPASAGMVFGVVQFTY